MEKRWKGRERVVDFEFIWFMSLESRYPMMENVYHISIEIHILFTYSSNAPSILITPVLG